MAFRRTPTEDTASSDAETPRAQTRADGKQKAAPTKPAATSIKARRRPAIMALGVAMIATGALGGAWFLNSHNKDRPVVMVKANLQPGQKISRSDLTTTDISGGAAAALVPGSDLPSLVGTYPLGSMQPGTLLTKSMVTNSLTPREGSTIVGIPVKTGQLPGIGVQSGDNVTLVLSAGSGSANLPSELKPGQSWNAEVSSVHTQSATNGQGTTQVVDVTVSAGQAPQLAEAAGTGQLTVVLNASKEN